MDPRRHGEEAVIMTMRQWVTRIAGGSRVVTAVRRVCAGSLLCAGVAAMFRPSLAYLGGPHPPETDAQSRESIERLWRVVLESVPGRGARRVAPIAARVWRDSAVARGWAAWTDLPAVDRVRIAGRSGLAAAVAASLLKLFSPEPWPPLSIMIWVATIALAALAATRPREFHIAWTASRLRHGTNAHLRQGYGGQERE
jgi:hypothetical protein